METELQELIMNIENDDGNGWMKAGLPELGAPPFLFLSKCKGDRLNARKWIWKMGWMNNASYMS